MVVAAVVAVLFYVHVKNTAPPTNFSSAHSISAHTTLDTSVVLGSYNFTAFSLSAAPSLEFCNQEQKGILYNHCGFKEQRQT